jgi:hypothetical protein
MTNHIPFARHSVPSLVHVTIADMDNRSVASVVAREISLKPGLEMDGLHLNASPAFRKRRMFSICGDVIQADTASQNAKHGGDVARATSQVIAKRVALGLSAAFDPAQADHAEFERIIPEKVEAFAAAGMAMLRQSVQAHQQMLELASEEVIKTAGAMIEMTGCSGPAAFVDAPSKFARAWLSRAASGFMAVGALALASQAATMAPIRQTVVSNAERLRRLPTRRRASRTHCERMEFPSSHSYANKIASGHSE